ncbi:hypothetical protein AKJ16_DCAP25595 [Drosera capensis]
MTQQPHLAAKATLWHLSSDCSLYMLIWQAIGSRVNIEPLLAFPGSSTISSRFHCSGKNFTQPELLKRAAQ